MAEFSGRRLNTRQDAIAIALEIAGGSCARMWNDAISMSDYGVDRVQAMAASAQADAADVAMLCSLASVLPNEAT